MVEAQHRGFPVDEKKHEAFGRKIYAEINAIQVQVRGLVPESILGLHPKPDKKKKMVGPGYVGIPRSIKDLVDELGNPKNGQDKIIISEDIPILDDDDNETGETETVEVVYTQRSVEVFNKESLETETLVRWVKLLPFSSGSVPQKLRLYKI